MAGDMSSKLCVDCGSPIPSSRTELVPTTLRCIRCETEYEKTHDIRKSIYQLEAEEQFKSFQSNINEQRLIIGSGRGKVIFRGKVISSPSLARKQQKNANSGNNKPNQILVKCPHCNSNIRNDKLQNHINRVHRQIKEGQTSSRTKSQLPLSSQAVKNNAKSAPNQS